MEAESNAINSDIRNKIRIEFLIEFLSALVVDQLLQWPQFEQTSINHRCVWIVAIPVATGFVGQGICRADVNRKGHGIELASGAIGIHISVAVVKRPAGRQMHNIETTVGISRESVFPATVVLNNLVYVGSLSSEKLEIVDIQVVAKTLVEQLPASRVIGGRIEFDRYPGTGRGLY